MKLWTILLCALFFNSWLIAVESKNEPISGLSGNLIKVNSEGLDSQSSEQLRLKEDPILWGKVLDFQNQPLFGANLEWISMSDLPETTQAVSDGGGNIFLLNPIDRQKNDVLICRHDDFATWGKCHVDSKHFGTGNLMFEIHMSTGAGIFVDLVSNEGKPLPGANIFLESPLQAKGHCHDTAIENVMTDKFGRASVNQFLPGKVKLKIDLKGWTTYAVPEFNHGTSTSTFKVEMVKAKPFKLYFEDSEGLPLSDVNFQYGVSQEKLNSFDQLSQLQRHELKTKDNYSSEFQVPLNCYLHLKLSSNKYTAQPILNLECKSLSSYIYLIEALTEISGTVVDALTNEIIPKASVKIRYNVKNQHGKLSQTILTKKNGKFTRHENIVGELEIMTMHPNYKRSEKIIKKTNEMKSMVISLEPGVPLCFRLMQPIPHSEPAIIAHRKVKIHVSFSNGGNQNLEIDTDEIGEFKCEYFSTGDSLKLQVDGFAEVTMVVDSRRVMTEILMSPACSINIKVKDEEDQALKGVSFYIGNDYQQMSYLKESQAYIIKNIIPGQYKLKIQKYEFESQTIDVDAELGKLHTYEVKMKKSEKIAVILDPFDGIAPKSVMFQFKSVNLGSSGTSAYLVKGSQPPRYETPYQEAQKKYPILSVQMKGYLPANIELTDALEYKLQLEKGMQVFACVKDPDGKNVEFAKISLWDQENGLSIRETTGVDGKATLLGLTPAKYQVNIDAEGFSKSSFLWTINQDTSSVDWVINRGGTIRVNVIDVNGLLIENCAIKLQKAQEWGGFQNVYDLGNQGVAKTDEKGFAEFKGISAGDYRAVCNDKKYGLGESKVLKIDNGSVQVVELVLKSGKSISGRVVDIEGDPIIGVKLMATKSDGMGGGTQVKDSSDENGGFNIQPLKEGVYAINIECKDYDKPTESLQFEAGEKDILIMLKKSENIILEALGPDGTPLSDVEFFHRNEIQNYDDLLSEVMNDGSQYSISTSKINFNLNMGKSFVIKAKAKGYNPGESNSYTYGDWPKKIVVQLKKESSIEFVCLDDFGGALSGVQVTYQEKNANDMFRQQSRADTVSQKDGRLVLRGIEEGEYKFIFKHNDFSDATENTVVRYNDTLLHKVVMKKGGIIKGTVKDMDDHPLSGAYVWLQALSPMNDFLQQMSAQTSNDGHFEILRVPEGEYKISFRAKGSVMLASQQSTKTILVRDGEVCEVFFAEERVAHAGSLEVHFPESNSGQRYFGNLTRIDFLAQNFSGMMKGVVMVFDKVPAGQYKLTLFGNSMRTLDVEIIEGETTVLNLEEQKGYKLLAKIIDENGRVAATGWASLLPKDLESAGVMAGMSNVQGSGKIVSGRLEIFVTKAGRYNLMVQVQNGMRTRTLHVKDIEVLEGQDTDLGTLQLKVGSKMTGTVVDENGKPVSGAMFMVNVNGMPQGMAAWRSNSEGSFELDDVPEEAFQLNVFHSDFAPYKMDPLGRDNISIVMQRGTEILIQLTGTAISGRSIFLTNEEKIVQMSSLFGSRGGLGQQMSDELGQLKLFHIAAGRYRIQVLGNKGNLSSSVYSEMFEVYGSGQQRVLVPLPE